MLVFRSRGTGQVLFLLELDFADISVSPQEARDVLERIGASAIGYNVKASMSGSGAPVPVACMMGVNAALHPSVGLQSEVAQEGDTTTTSTGAARDAIEEQENGKN